MASIKHSFATFFVSVLLTSAVQGQSDLNFESCTYNTDATAVALNNQISTEKGNKLRTYEILCGKPANRNAFDNSGFTTTTVTNNGPVTTQTSVSFSTLCGYINGAAGVDIKKYIGEGVNPHTIFAPTDAAFNSIGGEMLTSDMVTTILQLHILGDTYLTSDLECDRVYDTLNLGTFNSTQTMLSSSDRQSKTKCRGTAGTIEQLGGGNTQRKTFPTIGDPINVFSLSGNFLASGDVAGTTKGFTSTVASSGTTTLVSYFSSNVIGCNGVIHVVNEVLMPPSFSGQISGKSGKSGKAKAAKSGKRRELSDGGNNNNDDEAAKQDREVSRENRRRRLEALLEPNGNIEQLN